MDFQTLKRRELQALCKLNNIPANLTNAAMADALQSLPTVQGIEDLLEQSQTGGLESPFVSQTSTRQKPSKEGLEGSEMATRTRCGTRKVALEGTDTRKTTTTATRTTTRRRAMQETSIQREMEKDMQAKFVEELEQSDISVNTGIESEETLVDASIMSVDHIMSRSQNKPEHKGAEVNNDGEVVDEADNKENMGKDHVVNEAEEESIEMSNALEKLDFHCLGRKDLQNLCKKNKIPANMTNAAMADALGSLDTVEGLVQFLGGYDPLAIKSPETSQRTSSRLCQARTARKTTGRKSARAGSAISKSVCRKMEDLNEENQGGPLDEEFPEKSEFVDHVPENSSTINGESKRVSEEEALNDPDTSTDALAVVKELQDEMVENICDEKDNEGTLTEMCDTNEDFEANNLSIESNTDNHSSVDLGQEFNNLSETEVKLQDDDSENASNNQEVKVNISEKSNVDELVLTEPEGDTNELDECTELNDKSVDSQTLESKSNTDSSDKPHSKGLVRDAPAVGMKELNQSSELSNLEADNEVKEPEDDNVEHPFVFETAQASQYAQEGKATPLCHKSLRKLKKLVKEKLKETNLLAKKLEKLTLQDNEVAVDIAEVVEEDLREETIEPEEISDELNSTTLSVCDDVGEVLSGDTNNVSEEPTETGTLKEDGEPIISLSLEPVAFTTPSKSSSRKTPISAGRTLRVLDANKENIDESAAKTTEPGKIKITVTPAKSIGKLKKEVKVLLQQSEKKRPALQSRSDNQCPLTSP